MAFSRRSVVFAASLVFVGCVAYLAHAQNAKTDAAQYIVVDTSRPVNSFSPLRALGGVTNVELRGDTVLVQCTDSDTVARYLLTHTAARDLEISSKNLEAAFVALTADDPSEDGASR